MVCCDNIFPLAIKTRHSIVDFIASYGKQITPIAPYKLSGVCGIASYILHQVFLQNNYTTTLACGSYKNWPHAFVVYNDLIVDITATQFGRQEEVYISNSSDYQIHYTNQDAINRLKQWPNYKQPFQYIKEIEKIYQDVRVPADDCCGIK